MSREEALRARRATLVAYLLNGASEEDWHAVADAACDLRCVDAELKGLKPESCGEEWEGMGVGKLHCQLDKNHIGPHYARKLEKGMPNIGDQLDVTWGGVTQCPLSDAVLVTELPEAARSRRRALIDRREVQLVRRAHRLCPRATLAHMQPDPEAFVVGPMGDGAPAWGVRSGDNSRWLGCYHNLRVAAFACTGVSGDRFVIVKADPNAQYFQTWDARLGEFVSEAEKAERLRRSSSPAPR